MGFKSAAWVSDWWLCWFDGLMAWVSDRWFCWFDGLMAWVSDRRGFDDLCLCVWLRKKNTIEGEGCGWGRETNTAWVWWFVFCLCLCLWFVLEVKGDWGKKIRLRERVVVEGGRLIRRGFDGLWLCLCLWFVLEVEGDWGKKIQLKSPKKWNQA